MMARLKWWLLLVVGFWFSIAALGSAVYDHRVGSATLFALAGAICIVKAIKELSRSFSL